MKTSTALKMKTPRVRATSPQQRREEIARKAAAVSRHWSAEERQLRSELAEQLQLRLFASIVNAGAQLQLVA